MAKRSDPKNYKMTNTSCAPDQEKQWQAQSDLRTLRDAIEIRKDKERFKAAQEEAKKQTKALADIAET